MELKKQHEAYKEVKAAEQELKAAQEAVARNLDALRTAQEAVWDSKDADHKTLIKSVQAAARAREAARKEAQEAGDE